MRDRNAGRHGREWQKETPDCITDTGNQTSGPLSIALFAVVARGLLDAQWSRRHFPCWALVLRSHGARLVRHLFGGFLSGFLESVVYWPRMSCLTIRRRTQTPRVRVSRFKTLETFPRDVSTPSPHHPSGCGADQVGRYELFQWEKTTATQGTMHCITSNGKAMQRKW